MAHILGAMEVMLFHVERLEIHLEQTRQTICLSIVNGPDIDLLLGSFATARKISVSDDRGSNEERRTLRPLLYKSRVGFEWLSEDCMSLSSSSAFSSRLWPFICSFSRAGKIR